jgi:hypothetical protein
VDLSNLPNLRVFSLDTKIYDKTLTRDVFWVPYSVALHDINIVLGTIPECNAITNLRFDFVIVGWPPFDECPDRDWVEMFNEIIRISGGKPLELELKLAVCSPGTLPGGNTGEDELYVRIMENAALLSDYPNICTHWRKKYISVDLAGRVARYMPAETHKDDRYIATREIFCYFLRFLGLLFTPLSIWFWGMARHLNY